MSLCPECAEEIPSGTTVCPICADPVAADSVTTRRERRVGRVKLPALLVVLVVVAVFGVGHTGVVRGLPGGKASADSVYKKLKSHGLPVTDGEPTDPPVSSDRSPQRLRAEPLLRPH